ncbi:hypothetical protein F7734_36430 [Scytonema sp. UIC 10036]|uniref:hypothetical protein n=1 Tax=Scytonema sp. UIC 10036 TaxID=2304196 RepID=UPI0012DA8BA5|nr:hypothetical protein [Scytonema sp. UIC 10036]MUG97518.1 hypothetical protein [Scytonema sp. UIC 10036]
MKESIIKISKPVPKVPPQSSDSELLSIMTQPEEFSIPEEPQEPELEPVDTLAEPAYAKFASTNSSGWKASDILREIRLDYFDMGGAD